MKKPSRTQVELPEVEEKDPAMSMILWALHNTVDSYLEFIAPGERLFCDEHTNDLQSAKSAIYGNHIGEIGEAFDFAIASLVHAVRLQTRRDQEEIMKKYHSSKPLAVASRESA